MNDQLARGRRGPVFRRPLACGLLAATGAALLLASGCRKSSTSSDAVRQTVPEREVARRDKLFDYVFDTLNRLEEFEPAEMLNRLTDRLDRWVRDQKPLADWAVDPLVGTLPQPLQELPVVKDLDRLGFTADPPYSDGYALLEAVWLRDVSTWARGEEVGDIVRAKRLFDWTVKNIQLEPDLGSGGAKRPEPGPEGAEEPNPGSEDAEEPTRVRVLKKPWETLLLGRGTASERAWVFILLARHQGLDAAVVVPADASEAGEEGTGHLLVGVLSGGELYLFDPALGLPIPARDGVKLDRAGGLEIEPATLSEVAADDALLRRLDVDDERRYPLDSSRLNESVVLLEASPAYISERMKLVENRLVGDARLVLTTDASGQGERMKACRHVGDVRLWPLPYETIRQEIELGAKRGQWWAYWLAPFLIEFAKYDSAKSPTALALSYEQWVLWRGRSCHLKGKFVGSSSATEYYQRARPSDRELAAAKMEPRLVEVYLRAKLRASYWLGLIAAHEGNDASAIDYFKTRSVDVAPQGPWTQGALYNLARVCEGSRRVAQAIEIYRSDDWSAGYHGNLLRARWLESPAMAEAPP